MNPPAEPLGSCEEISGLLVRDALQRQVVSGDRPKPVLWSVVETPRFEKRNGLQRRHQFYQSFCHKLSEYPKKPRFP